LKFAVCLYSPDPAALMCNYVLSGYATGKDTDYNTSRIHDRYSKERNHEELAAYSTLLDTPMAPGYSDLLLTFVL